MPVWELKFEQNGLLESAEFVDFDDVANELEMK